MSIKPQLPLLVCAILVFSFRAVLANTNDNFQDATTISSIDNYCSADAGFDNITATADGITPSGWWSAPKKNVWFKFQATTQQVKIDVKSGDTYGTLKSPQLALFDANQAELISNYNYYGNILQLSYDQLTVGDWYYFSVDVCDPYNQNNKQGTFTLCVDDAAGNDLKSGAIELTNLSNWCSENAAFTNVYGTPDGTKPASWGSGPKYNVWFKFQAATPAINIEIKSGDEFGSMDSPQLALYNASGEELVGGENYGGLDLSITYSQLTTGEWYYINVDVADPYNTKRKQGTFTLCMDDAVSNDFFEGALELTDLDNWCSGNAAFTNAHGTPDGSKPSGWGSGPKNNVWFKFLATTAQVKVAVMSGGEYGTLNSPQIALHDADRQELISNHLYNNVNLSLSYDQLTVGEWYFINIDVDDPYSTTKKGTFTLCIDDVVSNDFKEGAIELTDLNNWCSENAAFTNVHGTPDGPIPTNWGSHGPDYNVWFKFRATTSVVDIDIKSGGELGTLNSPELALYDADMSELISAKNYNGTELSISYETLIPGQWYFLDVDVDDGYDLNNKQGTFTLCVDNWDESVLPIANSLEVIPMSDSSIQLIWTDTISSSSQYDIYRLDTGNTDYHLIATITDNSRKYDDYGLTEGKLYTYKIRFSENGIAIAETEVKSGTPYYQGMVPDYEEYLALKALYESTNGDEWTFNKNWLIGYTYIDFKIWERLYIVDGDVYGIFLDAANATGSIPAEIVKLQSLGIFYACDNYIKSVPDEIGFLPKLWDLTLYNNQIEDIPASVGNLSSGIEFYLWENNLTSLPEEILNISNIKCLYIEKNFLDFEDLEPFADLSENLLKHFVYSPQKTFGDSITFDYVPNNSIFIDSKIGGGQYTHYQWQKYDGSSWVDVSGQVDSVLNIVAVQESDEGNYRCIATNDVLPDLTLETGVFTINIIDNIINNYDAVLYVNMDGIDSTATINDLSASWALPHTASVQAHTLAQSDGLKYLVYVRKGTYEDYWVTMPGVDIYFEEDAVVWYNTDNTASRSIISDWRGGAGDYKVLGKGRFYVSAVNGGDDRDAVNFKYNSTISTFECKEFNSIQLWNSFNSHIEINDAIIRSPQMWNTGLGATFNNCVFTVGYNKHMAGYNINGTHEIFNNCTFILPDSSEIDENLIVVNHLDEPLFSFKMVQENLRTNTTNLTQQEVADLPYFDSQGLPNTVASFSIEPIHNPWIGWIARCYTFTYTLNNPTFIVNRPNCSAVRVIWSEPNPNIDYSWEGIKIIGGKAEAGPNGTNPVFLQADKIDGTAADIPIEISGTTHEGFTERIFATDYFPMGVSFGTKTYHAIQSGSWNNPSIWAVDGVSDGTVPTESHEVVIDGFEVIVSDTQQCGIVNINNNVAGTGLVIDNGNLTVKGYVSIANTDATKVGASFKIVNGGSLEIIEE